MLPCENPTSALASALMPLKRLRKSATNRPHRHRVITGGVIQQK